MRDKIEKCSLGYSPTKVRRSKPRARRIDIAALGIVLVALSITACKSAPPVESEYYGAQIGIVNHTDRYIDSASVGGEGGGNSYGYHTGVANICCVRVPVKWHPGLQLVVRWNMPDNITPVRKEKIVDVEKYDEPGSIYVHFFPDDHVRIVVTNWASDSKKHPIPPPPRELWENLKTLRKKTDHDYSSSQYSVISSSVVS